METLVSILGWIVVYMIMGAVLSLIVGLLINAQRRRNEIEAARLRDENERRWRAEMRAAQKRAESFKRYLQFQRPSKIPARFYDPRVSTN